MIGDNLKCAIMSHIEGFHQADRERIRHAIEAGNLLWIAKDELQYGAWLPFLKEIGLEPRTAQRWMAIRHLTPEQVREFGGLAKAARVARMKGEGVVSAYREASDRYCTTLEKQRDAFRDFAAERREFAEMAEAAYRALCRERGMTDQEIAVEIAAVEAEMAAEAADAG